MSTRPISTVLNRLEGVGHTSDGYRALCPGHDDREPSLSICEGDDGTVLVYCHAGCQTEQVVSALGLTMADLFPTPDASGRGGTYMHADTSATTQQHWGTGGLTVKQYAEAKKLPVDFLLKLGITDITYMSQPAVRIPYFGLEGEEMAVRFRTALKGRNRFRWRKGTKPCLYGLWQLADWGSDYIILVEGESDCHTLWVNDFPALGLPGAGIWNESRDGPYLDGYKTIYVVIEPDKGGETVISWLKKSSIRTRAKLVNLADLKI